MSDGNPIDRVPSEPAVVEVALGAAHTERVERAANAAHVLCDVLWEALHEQLGARSDRGAVSNGGSARTLRARELAERLADVAATVALLAGADGHAIVAATPNMAHTTRSGAPAEPTATDAPPTAVLIDEREEQAPASGQGPAPAASPPRRPQTNLRLIGRALEQFERDRHPFAVLLVELLDVKSLRLGGRAGELPRLTLQIESAFTQALEAIGGRPAASLTSERPDRYWLLVRETDRLAAQALVDRLVRAFVPVRVAAGTADPAEQYFAALSAQRSPLRAEQNGAPLQLAVGTAVCPDHGQEAAALVAHAEVELSAARAAGQLVVSLAEPV